VSRSRTIEQHLKQLRELQTIIASMKTLSQLELHKLGGVSASQHALAVSLQRMAADFYYHNPQGDAGGAGGTGDSSEEITLWLLLGSERGFCGDFNEALVRRLPQLFPDAVQHPARVLAVGRKLWSRLEESLPGYTPLAGANVSEELQRLLTPVVNAIQQRMSEEGLLALHVLYHDDEKGALAVRRLLPPEIPADHTPWRAPPLLQLPPREFLHGFLQHYLLLGLSELFTVSLLAENQYRVQHLEGAVHRLDERLAALSTRANALRQEEITEEIEMILLASPVADFPGVGG
jgi:F-type H+-transporting ATPase subunit gamma